MQRFTYHHIKPTIIDISQDILDFSRENPNKYSIASSTYEMNLSDLDKKSQMSATRFLKSLSGLCYTLIAHSSSNSNFWEFYLDYTRRKKEKIETHLKQVHKELNPSGIMLFVCNQTPELKIQTPCPTLYLNCDFGYESNYSKDNIIITN